MFQRRFIYDVIKLTFVPFMFKREVDLMDEMSILLGSMQGYICLMRYLDLLDY